MARKKVVATNSEYGLYNNTNPSYNLYVGTQSRLSKSAKSMRVPKYSADGNEDDLGDDFVAVMVYNPDNNEQIALNMNEPIFLKNDGKYRKYGTKANGKESNNEYDTFEGKAGDIIGAVVRRVRDDDGYIEIASWNRKKEQWENELYGKNWIPAVKKNGEGSENDGANFYVLRKKDDLGKSFVTLDVTKKARGIIANVLTGGLYGLTKKATAFGLKLLCETNRLFNKKSRDDYKKYQLVLDDYNAKIREGNAINDKLSEYDVKLATQTANPKSEPIKATPFGSQIFNFTTEHINYLLQDKYFVSGVMLKNYLDKKCKKATSSTAEYKDIIDRLFFSGCWYRNNYNLISADCAKKVVDELLSTNEIHKGDKEFGFTKSIADGMPKYETKKGTMVIESIPSKNLDSIAIAYSIKQLGLTIPEKDDGSMEYIQNKVKVCSYAYWSLYLSYLKYYVAENESKAKDWINSIMVETIVSKGYNTGYIQSLQKDTDTFEKFYKKAMRSLYWINALSTNKLYKVYDFDLTYDEMEALYERGKEINKDIPNLLKKIRDYQTEHKFTSWSDKELTSMINSFKSVLKFDISKSTNTAKVKAIREGKRLKRELLSDDVLGKALEYETEQEKIKVNMEKTAKDIATYQLILDDTSNDENARNNADKMLEKLTDDLDKYQTKLDESLKNAEEHDEKEVNWREDAFNNLIALYSCIGDIWASYKRKEARKSYRAKIKAVKDELKSLYGKGWRKEGDWKSVKIEYKVERNQILEEYQSVFGKIAHGTLAFLLMPARNICTIILMLNIGGMTTRLEQMKLVHDSNDKTSDAIKIRNAYELVLQRWYSIGGKKEFLENIITKYGKAKPIANKSSEPDKILEENGYDIEQIASKDTELKLDAEGKKYYNFVVSEYIATIVGYVKSFVGWLCTALKGWLGYLITALKAIGNLFGRNKDEENYMSDDDSTIGNGIDDEPALNSASQIALLEAYIAQGVKPILTEEQKQSITDLICDKGYTFLQAFEEVTGMVLSIDENGNFKNETRSSRIWAGVGIGVGLLAVGGILWAIFSDNK